MVIRYLDISFDRAILDVHGWWARAAAVVIWGCRWVVLRRCGDETGAKEEEGGEEGLHCYGLRTGKWQSTKRKRNRQEL